MRTSLAFIIVFLLPLTALAQTHSNAPMLVIGEGAVKTPPVAAATPAQPAIAAFPNFPEIAITRVGEKTAGQAVAVPPTPASPAPPSAAASGTAAPTNPSNPTAPATPVSPVSKLWPRDTIQIFIPPCTGLRPQFVVPCTCVITKLMLEMPHDEFLAKSANNSIEQDPRLMRIRRDCATTPQKKE